MGDKPRKKEWQTNESLCYLQALMGSQCRAIMEIIRLLKDEVNLATLSFGDITEFKTVVSVSLHIYMYIYICMNLCIYIYTYIFIYIYMCAYTRIYTFKCHSTRYCS